MLEQELFVAVLRTQSLLYAELTALLKEHGVTEPQFNVLRILRGAGDQPLTCSQIGERMVTRIPDITRLLDRLERRGLVERTRDSQDRRAVLVRILPIGLELLSKIDTPVMNLHRVQFHHLDEANMSQLSQLLTQVRRR